MPWKVTDAMSLRAELVSLMQGEGANVSELCRRFGVSRKTAYKWLARVKDREGANLADRSRRPKQSPLRTRENLEREVVRLRAKHPAWGGRKLKRRLEDLGVEAVPAASTVHAILRRHDLLNPAESAKHRVFQRFEHPAPNDLLQMDYKGHFAIDQGRCHPLTVIDDHSRYALELGACGNERTETVRDRLTAVFRRYGLPKRMLCDNGPPWSDPYNGGFTQLTLWLMRLSITVSHGRPYHPQTQGKDERFHRTLTAEVLANRRFTDLAQCQRSFDSFRQVYNHERPHEALGLAVPASRYRISQLKFPEVLPDIEYAPDVHVRKMQKNGFLTFQGKEFRLPKVFVGQPLGLRPTIQDGVVDVLYGSVVAFVLDLRSGKTTKPVTHVSEHLLPMSPV
jgi:transposase InsO family protein